MFFVFKLFHLVFLLQQFPLALVLAKRDQDSKNTKTLNRQDKLMSVNVSHTQPVVSLRVVKKQLW